MPLGTFLIFAYLAISMASVVLLGYAYPFRKFRSVQYLILMNVACVVFAFCTLNVYIVQDFEWKVFFSRSRWIGLSFLGQSILLLMSQTLDRGMWLHNKRVLAALFLPSFVTIVITLVPSFRDFMFYDFQPFAYQGLDVVSFKGGPWFKVQGLLSYAAMFMAVSICIRVLIFESGLRRKQALILVSALLFTMSLDFYSFFAKSPIRWAMVTTSFYCLNQFSILYCSFVLGFGHLIVLARQRIFELVPDPILVFDARSRLALLNNAAKKAFGFNSSEITRNVSDLVSDDLLTPGVKTVRHVSGEEFIYDVSDSKLSDDPTLPFGNLVYFRNVTNQKQVEKRLEDLLQFDASLLSMISHDLSGNLQNQARLAAGITSKLAPEDRKIGAILEESAFASRDLIHGLITWAKSQSIDLPSPRKPFELKALIEDSVELLRPLMAVKSLSCDMQSTEEPIIIVGDSGMVSSVVRNLFTNAINASHEGKSIRIEIQKEGDRAHFSVIDEGPGISDAVLSSALEEAPMKAVFQKQGYGVGIKLSQKFVLAHKGELSILGLPGKGTTAKVSLPV